VTPPSGKREIKVRSLKVSKPSSIQYVYLLLLITIACAAFGQSLFLPFIQDDWGLIHAFQNTNLSIPQAALNWFNPSGALLYRPAGLTCLFCEYRLFGQTPAAFHFIALLIHIANSFLVFRIAIILAKDRWIGMLTGLIYAVAAAVHLDTLTWVVAIYDLGAMLFCLCSILLFLHGRSFLSALCFLASVFFKESVVTLPLILAALLWLHYRSFSWSFFKTAFRKLAYHAVVCGMVVFFKLFFEQSLFSLPSSHPYAVSFTGKHVFHNAYVYLMAMTQTIVPAGTIDGWLPRIVALGIAFLLLQDVTARFYQGTLSLKNVSLELVLAFWAVVALLPVLFMPNHTFRYYAVLSLPAFICGILVLFRDLLFLLHIPAAARWRLMAAAGACVVCLSVVQCNRIYRQGILQRTLSDYSCNMVERAAVVNVVQSTLLQQVPHPPDHAIFIFDGIDPWVFEKDKGLQAWYHDNSIRAYPINDLRWDSKGPYLDSPPEQQAEQFTGGAKRKIYLDRCLVKIFRRVDAGLQQLTLDEVKPALPRPR
jgi:hypothetical protein